MCFNGKPKDAQITILVPLQSLERSSKSISCHQCLSIATSSILVAYYIKHVHQHDALKPRMTKNRTELYMKTPSLTIRIDLCMSGCLPLPPYLEFPSCDDCPCTSCHPGSTIQRDLEETENPTARFTSVNRTAICEKKQSTD